MNTIYPARIKEPISIDPKNLVIIAEVLCIPYSFKKVFCIKSTLISIKTIDHEMYEKYNEKKRVIKIFYHVVFVDF